MKKKIFTICIGLFITSGVVVYRLDKKEEVKKSYVAPYVEPEKPLVKTEDGLYVRGNVTYLSKEFADIGCRCLWTVKHNRRILECKGCENEMENR